MMVRASTPSPIAPLSQQYAARGGKKKRTREVKSSSPFAGRDRFICVYPTQQRGTAQPISAGLRRFCAGDIDRLTRGTRCAAISVERMMVLMKRHYQETAVLLFVGILLLFGGMFSAGLGRLGGVLVIASSIALLLGIIDQRRGAQ
jgi:hypothetical protein